jgi:hypothetical protein
MRDVSERAFDSDAIRAHAEAFGTGRFETAMARILDATVRGEPC